MFCKKVTLPNGKTTIIDEDTLRECWDAIYKEYPRDMIKTWDRRERERRIAWQLVSFGFTE
jgi:hypothetical protein